MDPSSWPSCAVQVVVCEENPSPQEIMERYILENRPGLFRGLLDDWPAQQRWVRDPHFPLLWLQVETEGDGALSAGT